MSSQPSAPNAVATKSSIHWTFAEDEELLKFVQEERLTHNQIAERMPGRTGQSTRLRILRLMQEWESANHVRWTEKMDGELKQFAIHERDKPLHSLALRRSMRSANIGAIRKRLCELGYARQPSEKLPLSNDWRARDDAYLWTLRGQGCNFDGMAEKFPGGPRTRRFFENRYAQLAKDGYTDEKARRDSTNGEIISAARLATGSQQEGANFTQQNVLPTSDNDHASPSQDLQGGEISADDDEDSDDLYRVTPEHEERGRQQAGEYGRPTFPPSTTAPRYGAQRSGMVPPNTQSQMESLSVTAGPYTSGYGGSGTILEGQYPFPQPQGFGTASSSTPAYSGLSPMVSPYSLGHSSTSAFAAGPFSTSVNSPFISAPGQTRNPTSVFANDPYSMSQSSSFTRAPGQTRKRDERGDDSPSPGPYGRRQMEGPSGSRRGIASNTEKPKSRESSTERSHRMPPPATMEPTADPYRFPGANPSGSVPGPPTWPPAPLTADQFAVNQAQRRIDQRSRDDQLRAEDRALLKDPKLASGLNTKK